MVDCLLFVVNVVVALVEVAIVFVVEAAVVVVALIALVLRMSFFRLWCRNVFP